MNLNGCRLLRAISFCALLTGSAASSRAEIIYGVDASQLLSVDSTTGLTTRLFDLSNWAPGGTAWTGDANALAYDAYAQNLIFSEVNGSRIGIYNTSTLTVSVLADLDMFGSVTSVVIGGTVDGNMGGGAFFYNDSYYFTVEDVDGGGAQHSRMFRANLNASHTAFTSVGLITFGGDNPWLGDFGDLAAINNGTVYGSTVRTDTSLGVLYGLWSVNIENPDAGFTTINPNTPHSQLAFSADGTTLFATQFLSGSFGTINLATGAFTATGTLSGDAIGLTDMSQAFSPVPEPSSALLLVAGLMLLFRRRGHAVSRITAARSTRPGLPA